MNELIRQAQAAATASAESSEAAKRSAQALTAQEELTRQALTIADRSAVAAEKSAATAERSAETTQHLTEASLRAWVYIQKHTIPNGARQGDAEFPLQLVTTVVNHGKTPALNVIAHHEMGVTDDVLLLDPDDYNDELTTSRGPLGPDGTFTLTTDLRGITDDDRMRIAESDRYLYVFGYVKYRTVFDNKNWQVTKWCVEYDPEQKLFRTYALNNE